MTRGGPRQGTPGKAYPQRADMNANRAPETPTNTAASAGVQPAPPMAPVEAPGINPDSVLPLDAPTQRPDEPVTAGAPYGPGPGPINMSRPDLIAMKQYLPYLNFVALQQGTPDSVKAFTQYLQALTP